MAAPNTPRLLAYYRSAHNRGYLAAQEAVEQAVQEARQKRLEQQKTQELPVA